MNERRSIALHESGHALFSISQGGEVEWLSGDGTVIDKKGKRRRFADDEGNIFKGVCFFTLPDELRDRPEIRLASVLSGVEAEFTVTGQTEYAGELLDALDLAREWLPDESEVNAACLWYAEWLAGLFTRNTIVLDALATALVESDDGMDGAAVAEVVTAAGGITHSPLPDWVSVREQAMVEHAGQPFFSITD